MRTILIVDDEQTILESFRIILKDNYRVLTANSGEKAFKVLDEELPDLMILDLKMPGMGGMEVLQKVSQSFPGLPVIIVTATKDIKSVIEAMKLGATDFVVKPFDVDEIKLLIDKTLRSKQLASEVSYLRSEVNKNYGFNEIIGQSMAIKGILDTVERVAKGDTTVLVQGESGTGKELIARRIHMQSPRQDKPFIAVHCPALPEHLLESELFGHEKGSFTSASERKLGRFELANTGTIFLDEISEMNLSTQGKILRVLQEHEFERVGGTRTIKVDARVIVASNKNLKDEISKGTFREDLYYRVNVVPICLPPLRERKEDIPLLVKNFINTFCRDFGCRTHDIHPDAMTLLQSYHWPGNIRELRNVIERIMTLYGEKEIIMPEYLPREISGSRAEVTVDTGRPALGAEESLDEAVARVEKELILQALERTHGVQAKAAELLKTTRRILKYKMDKLGLTQEDKGEAEKENKDDLVAILP
ncbi:MAG: sigma-54-dependent Fis family transcriptional regulator [Planctomycetes bacterium]|nr:sigma-54-dependent Fis family transcriptional regulator [Planctomycetota bacterium]